MKKRSTDPAEKGRRKHSKAARAIRTTERQKTTHTCCGINANLNFWVVAAKKIGTCLRVIECDMWLCQNCWEERGEARWIATPEKAFDLTKYTQNNCQTKSMHNSITSFPTDKIQSTYRVQALQEKTWKVKHVLPVIHFKICYWIFL